MQLKNDKLQADNAHLLSLNEHKRRFMGFIFQDFRVPLHTLTVGIEELLARGGLQASTKNMVNAMHWAAAVMRRLLDDRLCQQQLEEGSFKLDCQPFSLFDMLRNTIERFHPGSRRKNIR